MTQESDNNRGDDLRLEWVEPEALTLEISETSMRPGVGGDGEVRWADCTLS